MSLAVFDKIPHRRDRREPARGEVIACVTMLCALSALPMTAAIILVLFGA
jgi:hypothetical protein